MPIAKNEIIISVSGLDFSYGENKILNDINLDIYSGDYVGLIGPNGGGKTTLIKTILGLIKPDHGQITIFGEKVDQFKGWSKVGYVSQRAINFDPMFPVTVSDVVSMGLVSSKGLFSMSNKTDQIKIDQALESVQMLAHKHHLIGNLSGGQQQRVFIARSMVSSPEIIFLDEPTSGVDSKSQDDFYKILKKLNQEMGITLVLVSHDIDAVTNEVTKVVCINQNLVYHGSPKNFSESKDAENLYSNSVKFIVHRH